MLEDDADRLEELRALGEQVTYAGNLIWAIFDRAFYEAQGGDVGVESSQPMVTVRDVDVVGIAHGDTITRNGANYSVVGIHPDGTGMTEIVLEVV